MKNSDIYRVKVTFTGSVILELPASSRDYAIDAAMDEIEGWSENEFLDNLDPQVKNVAVKRLAKDSAEAQAFYEDGNGNDNGDDGDGEEEE
jgi:hypothetical protein